MSIINNPDAKKFSVYPARMVCSNKLTEPFKPEPDGDQPRGGRQMEATTASTQHLIGNRGKIVYNGMLIEVAIYDAKSAYGQLRVKVKPVAGSGFSWMNLSSVQAIVDQSGVLINRERFENSLK